MQLKMLLLGLFLSLCPVAAMAGGGHDHDHGHSHTPVDQSAAKANATKIVAALVERKKLDESWASITASSVEQRMFNGNPEWVAAFVNDKIADTDQQTLYVFLTLGGDYIAANYTGN